MGAPTDVVGGPDEVRAWTLRKGLKAPAAAGVIQ
jgi:ribosome-binding ATPase YchF (GTP1/OBG family)